MIGCDKCREDITHGPYCFKTQTLCRKCFIDLVYPVENQVSMIGDAEVGKVKKQGKGVH